jgi:hypothetical protein
MTSTESTRTREMAAFYAEHHRRVVRGVAAQAGAVDGAVLDDACAFAWSVLVRRDDVTFDRRGVNWLIIVGARKAWELARLARRETPVGGFLSAVDPGEVVEPAGLTSEPVDRLIALEEHSDRLARFEHPTPRERRDLLLQAAGYRYAEIASLSRVVHVAITV